MHSKIFVTGAAGFIGFHVTRRLLNEGYSVVGLDNINDYYDPELKYNRLRELGLKVQNQSVSINSEKYQNLTFFKEDLGNREIIEDIFDKNEIDIVINLAAQAGVRYSIENPHAYTASNINGFLNVLEGCRHNNVKHLIFASSSSVYGSNKQIPFKTSDRVDQPVSLYAATKKANELMAHTYSHLYNLNVTGLRFFTVYGPWGRPDMAYFKFANLIRQGSNIDVYNHGKMERDFTYIDDIVESISRLIPIKPNIIPPYKIYNIGLGAPVNLLKFIQILEGELSIKVNKTMLPMQPGDVERTWADVSDLYKRIEFKPKVTLEEGIGNFVDWYNQYYAE